MGVYTPEQALNAEKKGHDLDTVAIEIHPEKAALTGDCDEEESADNVYNETTVPVIRERRQAKQKRRLWLQLILIIGMLVGLTLCVIGSVHLYRGMRSTSYRGRCGVGVVDMSVMNFTAEERIATTHPWERDVIKCGVIEDVEIIGEIETLIVPKQNKSSPATFRHDFNKNQTAIKDDMLNLCFLVPFLPDFYSATVPNPADFSVYLNGRVTDADMPVVYELNEYFSVGGTVDDMLMEFGDALTDLCEGATPYRVISASAPAPGEVFPAYEYWNDLRETTPTVGNAMMVDVWYKMYPGGDALFNYHLLMDDYLYNYDSDL